MIRMRWCERKKSERQAVRPSGRQSVRATAPGPGLFGEGTDIAGNDVDGRHSRQMNGLVRRNRVQGNPRNVPRLTLLGERDIGCRHFSLLQH